MCSLTCRLTYVPYCQMHTADDFVITAMCKAVCTMALHPKCIPGLLSLLPAILATLQVRVFVKARRLGHACRVPVFPYA